MLKVGLTGGIATGKSYVTGLLKELGCEVADADVIARRVVEPGRPAFFEIVREFGEGVLDAGGAIDRAKLGAVVFAQPERRARLNAIVHPRVFEAQDAWLAEVAGRDPQAVAVVDAALMIESGGYKCFDKLVVVYCEPEIQLARLMDRNRLSREDALSRINAQMPTAEKLKYADYALDTSRGFEDTRRQVRAFYEELRRDAEGAARG
jgi:dephospho-CoA kinase